MYHQVTNDKPIGDTVITPARFAEDMKYLHDAGYSTISVTELGDIMTNRAPAPTKAVVITFDDGWSSVLNAVPILNTYDMKATFNIISGVVGGQYLTAEQVKALSLNPNFEIESHSVVHPWNPSSNLATWVNGMPAGKSKDDAINEVVNSKLMLEHLTGKPVKYIAWPSGYYNLALIEITKAFGYAGTMTIEQGLNSPGDDPYRIKRTFVDGLCSVTQFKQIVVSGISDQCLTK
jgi:peptidoglycan/xylan/chitin deacetylase (PgdA/CDA1 family)